MEKIEGIFCCSEKKDFEKNTEISLKPKIFLSKYFFGLDKFPFLILENPAHISNWFCEWLLPIRCL